MPTGEELPFTSSCGKATKREACEDAARVACVNLGESLIFLPYNIMLMLCIIQHSLINSKVDKHIVRSRSQLD